MTTEDDTDLLYVEAMRSIVVLTKWEPTDDDLGLLAAILCKLTDAIDDD
jgi:hypothetical protein